MKNIRCVLLALLASTYAQAQEPFWKILHQANNVAHQVTDVIRYHDGYFSTSRRNEGPAYQLFYRVWSPSFEAKKDDPWSIERSLPMDSVQDVSSDLKGVLIVVHGLRSHSGRYNDFAARVASSDYPMEVWAYDQLEHGNSPRWDRAPNKPVRGRVENIDTLVDHLDSFITFVKQARPNQPIYILSHSMGGLVAYKEAARIMDPQIKGMVFLAPALKYFDTGIWNRVKTASVKIGNKLGLGKLTLPLAKQLDFLNIDFIDVEKFSHSSYYPKTLDDGLTHLGNPHIVTGYSLIKGIDEIQAGLNNSLFYFSNSWTIKTVPLLFMHGTADQITNPEGSKLFFKTISDKAQRALRSLSIPGITEGVEAVRSDNGSALVLWEGAYHDLFGESSDSSRNYVRHDYEGYVLQWLRQNNFAHLINQKVNQHKVVKPTSNGQSFSLVDTIGGQSFWRDDSAGRIYAGDTASVWGPVLSAAELAAFQTANSYVWNSPSGSRADYWKAAVAYCLTRKDLGLSWHLPSKEDFLNAGYYHQEIRPDQNSVLLELPDMRGKKFWTATDLGASDPGVAWYYSGENGWLSDAEVDSADITVRCLAKQSL